MSNIIKSEEFEKWRQTSEMNKNNHGEENSPILRLHQQHQEDIISSISDKKMSTLKGASSFYITLAKESPKRLYEESDESTYDSYHCRETDICRDSTDLDDSSSDFGSTASSTQSFHAVMEVVEYDVASNISGNEALYSNDSSSGTDDFFLTAIATKRIRQLSKSYNNSDFADTEDSVSDKSYDPELSLADYWKCVKCKNKQNNPMFRYCEKCYQIRKSHFPPRPRRNNLKRKRNSPLHNTNNYGGTIITQSPTAAAAAAATTTTDLSVSGAGQCQFNVSSKLEANENGEQQKIEERLNSNDDNDRIGNGSNGSKGCKKFRLNSKLQTDNNNIGRNMYKLKKRKLFNNSKNNKSSEEMNSNSSSGSSNSNSSISDTNSIFDESSTEISEFEIEYSISSRGNRKRKISPKTKENVHSNNSKCYKGINKIKCINSGSSSSSSSGKMKNKFDNIKNKNLSKNNISLNDDKHVNNTENKVFKSAIKLNSDSENNDAIVSSSPCRRNITMLISQKDSGISSAPPSSQEMPSSSSSHSDDPHILSNNRYSEEDDDDSDTVVEELDDKELKEIREKYTNSPINQNENISMKFLDNIGNSNITSCDKTIRFSSITSSLSSSEINVNCNTDRNVTKNNSEITFRDFSGIMNNDEENNKNNNQSSSLTSVTPTKRNISNFNNSPSSRNNNNNNNSTGTNDNTNSIENGQCVVCLSEPKNGAFIHTKSAHLCCCYKCAVKIWNTRKKCPVCNCSVKNVLKLFVH